MLHHSLEHMQNPYETFQTIFELLNTKGVCVVRIPIVSSYAWRYYGTNWVQLDAPRHLFLHSVESMKILIQKAGFYLDKIIYDSSDFQFWASEQYAKNIPLFDDRSYLVNPNKSNFSKSEISAFVKHSKKLNSIEQGDQAVFYLKKA